MSALQHDQEADRQARAADEHAAQYDPTAGTTATACAAKIGACWTSVRNPTDQHREMAEQHRRAAADHRAASAALRDAEAKACVGIGADDRDVSPFERTQDIVGVEPLIATHSVGKQATMPVTVGAIVTLRAVPGLTAEWLQRLVDCHLARNAALGHEVPEMPNCPLVPVGASARVRSMGNGFAVEIRSDDAKAAAEILARADRLTKPT